MRCKRKQTYEYCPVEYIFWAKPHENPTFKGVPEWVHEAFKYGALRFAQPKIPGAAPVLFLNGAPIPHNAYFIKTQNGIDWQPDWVFKSDYEIID
jgi:hypothetical protein